MKNLKNEKRNKWLLFFVCILFLAIAFSQASCKKKTVTPPEPVYVCETGDVRFAGVYQCAEKSSSTFTIEFLHNNCPTENSNTYIGKGITEALTSFLMPKKTLAVMDYTLVSDEKDGHLNPFNHVEINITQSNPIIVTVYCNYLWANYEYFKIK